MTASAWDLGTFKWSSLRWLQGFQNTSLAQQPFLEAPPFYALSPDARL